MCYNWEGKIGGKMKEEQEVVAKVGGSDRRRRSVTMRVVWLCSLIMAYSGRDREGGSHTQHMRAHTPHMNEQTCPYSNPKRCSMSYISQKNIPILQKEKIFPYNGNPFMSESFQCQRDPLCFTKEYKSRMHLFNCILYVHNSRIMEDLSDHSCCDNASQGLVRLIRAGTPLRV